MIKTTFADPGDEGRQGVLPPTSYNSYIVSSVHSRNGYKPQLMWGTGKSNEQLTFTKPEDLSDRPPKKQGRAMQSPNWNSYKDKKGNSAY